MVFPLCGTEATAACNGAPVSCAEEDMAHEAQIFIVLRASLITLLRGSVANSGTICHQVVLHIQCVAFGVILKHSTVFL